MSGNSNNFVAGGTIPPSRFVIGDTDNDNRVLVATANAEQVVGVSQTGTNKVPLSDLVTTSYAAVEGEPLKVYGQGDFCLIEAGAATTRFGLLKADSVGRAVNVATTGATQQHYGAIGLEAAGAAGQMIRCQVLIGHEYPALA
ncbi:MAG TPA: hypothetical protein VMY37_12180 [Thermoguttaceae bacterium]|nr:hypothetical protein [Thermoguttaceae bacterium]